MTYQKSTHSELNKKHRPNVAFLTTGVVLLASAVGVAGWGLSGRMLHMSSHNTPTEAVSCGLDALCSGDLTMADKYMPGVSALLPGELPGGSPEAILADALRASYRYTITAPPESSGPEADVDISFTSLDVSALQNAASELASEYLDVYIRERDVEEVFGEDDTILPEVNREAYISALENRAEDAASYCQEREFTLHLTCRDGYYMIVPDASFTDAIRGGL